MVLMDVKLTNIYGFNNLYMNFSYPRKLKRTTIEGEFLSARPNFRYKKAVIIMGPNAVGKTTLGKALLNIFYYMVNGNANNLMEIVGDKQQEASFSIEYVNKEQLNLVRFTTHITPQKSGTNSPIIESFYSSCDIRETDSYENCLSQLNDKKPQPIQPSGFRAVLGGLGYRFCLSNQQGIIDVNVSNNKEKFLKVLRSIITTLDPTFTSIEVSEEFADSFILKRGSTQILIQKGVLQDNRDILSSGTKEGISIAILVAAIIQHLNGFYYCDEQFSHIQTDLEKRIFGIMVSHLGDGEQLIFTSHNSDMQDMNLPNHTFVYFSRTKEENGYSITVKDASEFLKRSTDSVRCAAENDVFSTIPDESLLDEIDEDNLNEE